MQNTYDVVIITQNPPPQCGVSCFCWHKMASLTILRCSSSGAVSTAEGRLTREVSRQGQQDGHAAPYQLLNAVRG